MALDWSPEEGQAFDRLKTVSLPASCRTYLLFSGTINSLPPSKGISRCSPYLQRLSDVKSSSGRDFSLYGLNIILIVVDSLHLRIYIFIYPHLPLCTICSLTRKRSSVRSRRKISTQVILQAFGRARQSPLLQTLLQPLHVQHQYSEKQDRRRGTFAMLWTAQLRSLKPGRTLFLFCRRNRPLLPLAMAFLIFFVNWLRSLADGAALFFCCAQIFCCLRRPLPRETQEVNVSCRTKQRQLISANTKQLDFHCKNIGVSCFPERSMLPDLIRIYLL